MKKNVSESRPAETKAVPPGVKQGKFENVDIDFIFPSVTNPRKEFNESDLKDLAASIKDKGVLQPLLIRVCKKEDDRTLYEVISGERRLRAAKLAGLKEVPCIHMTMTDQQVIETQVIENLQRTDLTPLEEAKSYEQLHEEYKYDWPELAAKIGKSQGYVFTRLNLLNLIPDFQKMLAKGELKLSYAEAITQVTDPEQQKILFNDITGYMCMPETVENLKEQIRDKFLLQLVNAPFPVKDKDLQGGPCGSCPKRTGAQADLFGELVGKQDTCRDAKCWADKKKEYEKKALAKYSDYAKSGHKVLVGAAAEDALASGRYSKSTDEALNRKTWAQCLKGTDYKTIIAVDAKGVKHELVNPNVAGKILHPENKKPSKGEKAQEALKAMAEMKKTVGEAAAVDILKQMLTRIKSMDILSDINFLKIALEGYHERQDYIDKDVLATAGVKGSDYKGAVLLSADAKDMRKLFVVQIINSSVVESSGYNGDNRSVGKPEGGFKKLLEYFKMEDEFKGAYAVHMAEAVKAKKEAEGAPAKEPKKEAKK